MGENPPILEVKNLTKKFGSKTIIQNVSFSVNQKDIFGFLGPNGAGKTTIIRMLVGLVKPTAGEISIVGYSIKKDFSKAMKNVGSIVENPELYGFLTGWENLLQFSRMIGLEDQEKIKEIVKLVQLKDRIHEKVKTYSLGMKQRLGIAQALLSDPKLLILDEPTNGLDPAGIRELRDFIHYLVEKKNMSVFISSHLLSEIELLCNKVAIIHKGQVIKESTVEELILRAEKATVFRVDDREKAAGKIRSLGYSVSDEPGVGLFVKVEDGEIPEIVKQLITLDIQVYEIRTVQRSLEDLFLELTGGEKNETAH